MPKARNPKTPTKARKPAKKAAPKRRHTDLALGAFAALQQATRPVVS
jgi:hypothetical protein